MINTLIDKLNGLKHESGLFKASPCQATGYNRLWIRDNLYISLAYEAINDKKTVEEIYHTLFDIFLKYEWKIDHAIKEKPIEDYKFIHPLYTKELEEIKEGWGWKQNDAIGGFLFHASRLQQKYDIIRDSNDLRIIKKLVEYLQNIHYWIDEDNGMWEESKEIHCSSVGACVAGLKQAVSLVDVPEYIIEKGRWTLAVKLPMESDSKITDLSLLSLIYPYNIVNKEVKKQILNNIKNHLERNKGIIRYKNDRYYSKNYKQASWTMGFPWMAIIYKDINNNEEYLEYIIKTISCFDNNLNIPELYIEDKYFNENNPLGWSLSLAIVALSL